MYYVLLFPNSSYSNISFSRFTLAKYFSFHDFPIGYLFLGGGGGWGEALSPEKLAYQERH